MARKAAKQKNALPTFEIIFENSFRLKGELYPGLAPNAAGRFADLANRGYYDGSVIKLMAPGGIIVIDQLERTEADCIPGEFLLNGCTYNTGRVCAGSLCFYHDTHYDSGSTGFFVVLTGASRTVRMVEGAFAFFGQVLEGLQLAEMLSRTGCDENGNPTVYHRIKSVRVETNGRELPYETCPEPESPIGRLVMGEETDDEPIVDESSPFIN